MLCVKHSLILKKNIFLLPLMEKGYYKYYQYVALTTKELYTSVFQIIITHVAATLPLQSVHYLQ